MPKIVENSITPYIESISTAFKLKIEEDTPDDVLLLKVEGSVFCDDDKYLSTLIQLSSIPKEKSIRVTGVSERQPYQSSKCEFEFLFTIDNKSLDYIEDRRQKNPKKDVIFKFSITVTRLRHSI